MLKAGQAILRQALDDWSFNIKLSTFNSKEGGERDGKAAV